MLDVVIPMLDMSPALRAVSSFVAAHPRLREVGTQAMEADMDNGGVLKARAIRIHVDGLPDSEDVFLCDTDGDVWAIKENGDQGVLCLCSSTATQAVRAFKAILGPVASGTVASVPGGIIV
jgi:hypothetical protein